MTKRTIVLLVLGVLILAGCTPKNGIIRKPTPGPEVVVSDEQKQGTVAVMNSDVIVSEPVSNAEVTSPLSISGRYGIESGRVVFRILDQNGEELGFGFIEKNKDNLPWEPFLLAVEYVPPKTQAGVLQVITLNADDEIIGERLNIPIRFTDFSLDSITVFYSNSEKDPEGLYCENVYPVLRQVPYGNKTPEVALTLLFAPPTEEEQASGYFTNLPSEPVNLNSVAYSTSTIAVDFDKGLNNGAAGSCKVQAMRAQIEETLKQFEGIEEVRISVDGDAETALQP